MDARAQSLREALKMSKSQTDSGMETSHPKTKASEEEKYEMSERGKSKQKRRAKATRSSVANECVELELTAWNNDPETASDRRGGFSDKEISWEEVAEGRVAEQGVSSRKQADKEVSISKREMRVVLNPAMLDTTPTSNPEQPQKATRARKLPELPKNLERKSKGEKVPEEGLKLKATRARKLPELPKNLERLSKGEKVPEEGLKLTALRRDPLPGISEHQAGGPILRETELGQQSQRRTRSERELESETAASDLERHISASLLELCSSCASDVRDKLSDRRCLCIMMTVCVISVLIIAGIAMVPISLVRLDRHELGLKIKKHESSYYSKPTYYPGTYMLGPTWEFLKFPYNAIMIEYENLEVFTVSRLTVSFEVSFQYFLRPEEIGELYKKFANDYERVFERISRSTLRNTIANFSVEQMRFNRTLIERTLHQALFRKLAGTCCMRCCRRNNCPGQMTLLCEGCDGNRKSCDPGFHAEVRYFQLGALQLPSGISQRLLQRIILQEITELEALKKNVSLVREETRRLVELVRNSANEITANGSAVAQLTTDVAHAEEDQVLQNATLSAWSNMSSHLHISREDHRLSLLWINTLDKMDNLVASHNYDKYSRAANVP